MRVNILPVALNISMAEGTLQELDSPNGTITMQKSDGLPPPERSGSPDLNARSSQWRRERTAYASKEDAHQVDNWPEAHDRKSEDVLVRYKDTRGKGLSDRMDPHAWSDFPTDTDDDVANNATSPVWNGAHDAGFSPKSATSKAELDISILQLKTTVPRNLGCVRMQSELVNIQYFASEDRWETVALDGACRQEADLSDAEKARAVSNTKLSIPVASSQNGTGSRAPEGDLDAGPERVPTLRNVPGSFSSQKVLDEQASLKMSHRYYTSGVDSNWRTTSIPSRIAARRDAESGKEDIIKHCGSKRNEKVEADYKPKTRKSATNEVESVKDESFSTSDDSDCSDAEYGKSSHSTHCDVDAEESFREMILQKYLVMLPGKAKKTQSMVRASADTKQKEGRCNRQIKTGEPTCRKLNSGNKNLHSVSPSRRQRFQLRKSLKKNPYPVPHSRQSISQLAAAALQQEERSNNTRAEAEAPIEEQHIETGNKSSLVALLKKSWSTGDLRHSKSLGDIGTLKAHALTHREPCQRTMIDFQSRLETLSGRCFAMESGIVVQQHEEKPRHTTSEGQNNNFTNVCIPSVEVPTTADSPLTQRSEEGEQHVPCDCLNAPFVLQGASKTQLSGAMEEAVFQCPGRVAKQGLSALALFSGPAEASEKPLKSINTHEDPSVVPFVGMPIGGQSVDDTHWIHEIPMSKEQVQLHAKGAEESSDGRSTHRAAAKYTKYDRGAEESSNGFCKPKKIVKKVTAVVPFDSCGDDQVLPDVSLAGQPASHTLLELQHEVESSKHHIADERRQPVRKQQTSPEHWWGTEKLAQQKKGFWDSTQELQKEKQNLLKRLQELEVHHPCNRLKAMSGTKVQLTEDDAKKLRQEILEQEALIRGYQVENEKAVAKLKEVQLEAKQKLQEMAEAKAHLASQLANRQMLGYGTDSASLHEKFQGALSRETALRNDLDKMRDSYMELEKRVKREESSRMKDLELKLTSLQETLEAERQSHAQMEGRKQAMIQQEELIASLQETISDQASNIRSLTTRLEGGEGLEKQDKKEAQLQIVALQNQVKRLEASLRASKKETGLHALQAAKSGMEENETFHRLQAELMAVQRNTLQRDEETKRIIHHLKVENDKIKHESATRIRNLNHQIQTQAKSGHSISESELSALNRIKDLEKQVTNLRGQYSRKVKELTDKLEEAKSLEVVGRSKTSTDNNTCPPARVPTTRLQPVQGKALREAKERIALQADVISQKDRTIKSLQKQILEATGGGDPTGTTTPGVPSIIDGEKRAKPAAAAREVLQQHCSSSTTSTHTLQGSMNSPNRAPNKKGGGTTCPPHNTGSTNGIIIPVPMDVAAAAADDEVAVLRRELEKSELTREVLQKTCNESVEKTVLLTLQHQQALQLHQIRQSQLNHHRPGSECQPISAGTHTSTLAGWGDHRSGLEGMNWLSERSSLEMANRALEARLKLMSEELEEANTMCQQSPRMTQIMNLKMKVAEMEARQHQKEMEWQNILQETKQTSSMEQEYVERKWRDALDSKSMEVEKIRLELNTILEAAMAMQHAQLQMNQKI